LSFGEASQETLNAGIILFLLPVFLFPLIFAEKVADDSKLSLFSDVSIFSVFDLAVFDYAEKKSAKSCLVSFVNNAYQA
jgi:hypothetical protein